MSHDLVRPLHRPKLSVYDRFNQTQDGKWALNTTKIVPAEEVLPKVQQYKEYNFPNRTEKDINNYKNTFLKSDMIALRNFPAQQAGNTIQHDDVNFNRTASNFSTNRLRDRKLKFGIHYESKKDEIKADRNYSTVTVNNTSGAPYNILTLDEKYVSKKPTYKLLDKKTFNMKKGICEFSDLIRPYAPNYNDSFSNEFKVNSNIFKKETGVFTHMYDRSHKNGNMVTPFGNRDNSQHKTSILANRYTMKNAKRRQEYNTRQEMKKMAQL